jgi:hypothetical protein
MFKKIVSTVVSVCLCFAILIQLSPEYTNKGVVKPPVVYNDVQDLNFHDGGVEFTHQKISIPTKPREKVFITQPYKVLYDSVDQNLNKE